MLEFGKTKGRRFMWCSRGLAVISVIGGHGGHSWNFERVGLMESGHSWNFDRVIG